MSDYFVGPQADYVSPQAAIDQLKTDVGVGAFSAEHRVIITNGATYEGYSVTGLTPTATYRLVITAATSVKPSLISRVGGELVTRCVDIDGHE